MARTKSTTAQGTNPSREEQFLDAIGPGASALVEELLSKKGAAHTQGATHTHDHPKERLLKLQSDLYTAKSQLVGACALAIDAEEEHDGDAILNDLQIILGIVIKAVQDIANHMDPALVLQTAADA